MKYVTLLCFLAYFGCEYSMAQPKTNKSPSELTQREQLKQEQKNIESSFAAKEAECYKKFSVNPCIDKARIEKNAAMVENKRKELLLNDQKREEKQRNLSKLPNVTPPGSAQMDSFENKLPSKAIVDPSKRSDSARRRVETINQKQREAQAKAGQRAKKNALSVDATKKYNDKMANAEAHKASAEQRNAENTKSWSLSLPIPKSIEK